ncbi:MAG: DUF4386 domain-containing protein, partial [Propionibacteriales bacterium]|nr:DUF4386 domain-containing protein [Propionibacteriales bacterium]
MSDRRTALIAGLLYLVTFAASIPALPLLAPLLDDPAGFVTGNGSGAVVLAGGLLDLINAAACIGTALVVYPVLRRTAPVGALGFVLSRTVEAAVIAVGVLAVLAVVTARAQLSAEVAQGLVALRNATFLLGPGLMPAANALFFGVALLRARLVPRVIPILGLIGAPLLLASALGTYFAVFPQVSVWSGIAVIPIFFWELSVGL